MPFTSLYKCTDCDETFDCFPHDHDCPNDPMKDPVKRAEFEAWEKEHDRVTAAWNAWQDEHGNLEHAYPSVPQTPDEIAFEGKCIVTQLTDYEGEMNEEGDNVHRHFTSEVLDSPTWGTIAREFDKAIPATGDYHHSFLEGLYKLDPSKHNEARGLAGTDVTIFRFSTGS